MDQKNAKTASAETCECHGTASCPIERKHAHRRVDVPVAEPTLQTDGRRVISWADSANVWRPMDRFVFSKWGAP